MKKQCPECGKTMEYAKYKDVINFADFYFTVVILACPNCGHLNDQGSYIE